MNCGLCTVLPLGMRALYSHSQTLISLIPLGVGCRLVFPANRDPLMKEVILWPKRSVS